jgi:hypothetical protein
MDDGITPLRRNPATLRRIARDAVRNVYLHGNGRFSPEFKLKLADQRNELAKNFRVRHNSNHPIEIDQSNEAPHFIGVFDTVAALGSKWQIKIATFFGAAGCGLLVAALIAFFFWHFGAMPFWPTYWKATAWLAAIVTVLAMGIYLYTHVKIAPDLKGYSWWDRWHFTGWKTQFYDRRLNINVGWARHALSLDENRKDFELVGWGRRNDWRKVRDGEPTWFKQLWFAGNHSDIGGSYSENESRLSDISLKWMVEEARSIPDGLIVDEDFLHLSPDPTGGQHDEVKTGIRFLYFFKLKWPIGYRQPVEEATLHPSVRERFQFEDGVLQYDEIRLYRPEVLRKHHDLTTFFQNGSGSQTTETG